jgi:protein CpxP
MKNNTTRILTITVILLLVANLVLVYFFVTARGGYGKREGRKDPMEMMAKELKMTDQQQKDFKSMKEEHFKNIRPLFDSMRLIKSSFFSLMKDSLVTDSAITAAEQQVLAQQGRLDRMTFEHFRRVRQLFTAEQLPKYDSFISKMMDRRRGPDRSGNPKDTSKEHH